MDWPTECAAVIPCLNEEQAIGSVVHGVRQHLRTIFVVDDGSGDRTQQAAEQAGATVLRQEQTGGKGLALKKGWQQAKNEGFQWVITLDGDGQHMPEDITHFFASAESTSARLVVGNRMSTRARMPWVRSQVNRWMSRRLSGMAGQELPDTQCGFRLMSLGAWSGLTIDATHFEIESDVLMAFVLAGHRVEFVPIQVIYKSEQSKIHPFHDTVRWLRWWKHARTRIVSKVATPK